VSFLRPFGLWWHLSCRDGQSLMPAKLLKLAEATGCDSHQWLVPCSNQRIMPARTSTATTVPRFPMKVQDQRPFHASQGRHPWRAGRVGLKSSHGIDKAVGSLQCWPCATIPGKVWPPVGTAGKSRYARDRRGWAVSCLSVKSRGGGAVRPMIDRLA